MQVVFFVNASLSNKVTLVWAYTLVQLRLKSFEELRDDAFQADDSRISACSCYPFFKRGRRTASLQVLKAASLNYDSQRARWSHRPRESSSRLLKRFCSSMTMIHCAVVFKFIVSVGAQCTTLPWQADGFTFKVTMIPRSYFPPGLHIECFIQNV